MLQHLRSGRFLVNTRVLPQDEASRAQELQQSSPAPSSWSRPDPTPPASRRWLGIPASGWSGSCSGMPRNSGPVDLHRRVMQTPVGPRRPQANPYCVAPRTSPTTRRGSPVPESRLPDERLGAETKSTWAGSASTCQSRVRMAYQSSGAVRSRSALTRMPTAGTEYSSQPRQGRPQPVTRPESRRAEP